MRAMTQTLYTDIISNVTHTHTHTNLTCYSVKITQSKAAPVALSQVRRVTWCDWLTLTFLSTIPGHWQQAPAAHSTHISVGQSWIRSLAMKTWTGLGPEPELNKHSQTLKEDWFSFHGHYNINWGILHSLLSTRKSFRLNNSFTICQSKVLRGNQDYARLHCWNLPDIMETLVTIIYHVGVWL